MKIAILADVRANELALLAVLARIEQLAVDRIWIIGSLLSDGPDPIAVVDRVRMSTSSDRCLLGHPDGHILDHAARADLNPHARRAIARVNRSLRPHWWSARASRARWSWLQSCPMQGADGDMQFYSGTPLHPDGDLLPISAPLADQQAQLRPHFIPIDRGAFVGTIGRPGMVRADALAWQEATDFERPMHVADLPFIACPESVGQPRDGDPRAAFAVWEDPVITWHRVDYDVQETMRRLRAQSDANPSHADRLAAGR